MPPALPHHARMPPRDPTASSTAPLPVRYGHADTPLGTVLLSGRGGRLTGLHFTGHRRSPRTGPAWVRDEAAFDGVRRQLNEYFAGRRTRFDLPLALGGTPFELSVWTALQGIPYGATASYGDIAHSLGRPGAGRAVGGANGRNPISIVVPCHRVIGADGGLTGYGWGVDRKAWLLDHERRGAHPERGRASAPRRP